LEGFAGRLLVNGFGTGVEVSHAMVQMTESVGLPLLGGEHANRSYAAEYQSLGRGFDISHRRATLLMNISRSWTSLANQLDRLADLIKEESK